MKEKDKAKEIVLAMQKNIHGEAGMVGGYSEQAKKCALIAVGMLVTEYLELNEFCLVRKKKQHIKAQEFWQGVQSEMYKF